MRMSSYVKKYLKAADVMEGPLIMHIADVKEGTYGPELVFESGETLSLNVTNNVTLIKAYGDGDGTNWIGMKIELYHGELEYKGKMVASVLVRPLTPGLSDDEKADAVTTAAETKRNGDMNDDIPF
jgi:hypothetical protein